MIFNKREIVRQGSRSAFNTSHLLPLSDPLLSFTFAMSADFRIDGGGNAKGDLYDMAVAIATDDFVQPSKLLSNIKLQ